MGWLKTYVTGTLFEALVAMDVTPYVALQPVFKDLVGDPVDRFSHHAAHIIFMSIDSTVPLLSY